MKVRLVTQMSGYRPDGSRWPDPGAVLDVSDDEGAELCRSNDHGGTPIAVPVTDERKAETAQAPVHPATETRAEEEPAEPESPAETSSARRGPGRPPGSRNRTN